MQFGWQTNCQQQFEIETYHVTLQFLILGICVPPSAKRFLADFSPLWKQVQTELLTYNLPRI